MKKILAIILLTLMVFSTMVLAQPPAVQAQLECTEETEGACINNFRCYCDQYDCYRNHELPCGGEQGSDVIGDVVPPPAITNWSTNSSTTFGGIAFLTTIIRLITIVAGIFVMFNFVAAGAKYVFAMGDTNANVEVRDKLLFSVIGLLIIVAAYTIVGLFGLIFFGDAGFILRPALTGATDLATDPPQ